MALTSTLHTFICLRCHTWQQQTGCWKYLGQPWLSPGCKPANWNCSDNACILTTAKSCGAVPGEHGCAIGKEQTAVQHSTLNVTEVQYRNGRLAAVFLRHHTCTSVLAQAHHANPHTQPSPAPPSMEKARAPSSQCLSGKQKVSLDPQF